MVSSTRSTLRKTVLVLALAALSGGIAVGPALAHDADDWRGDRHEWRDRDGRGHERREHEWREREWREHHRVVYYAPPPRVVYVPPPRVVYAEPRIIYREPPPPSLNIIIPLDLR
jgi:hypothetical protein